MSKGELLVQFTVSFYISGSLFFDILLITILNTSELVSMIFPRFDPRKWISIQEPWFWICFGLLVGEDDAFSLTLNWIDICAEGDLVAIGISLNNTKHVQQTTSGWTYQQQVICVAKLSSVVFSYPASILRVSQELEQIVHVEAEQDGTEHGPL